MIALFGEYVIRKCECAHESQHSVKHHSPILPTITKKAHVNNIK